MGTDKGTTAKALITTLHLKSPPVALTRVSAAPAGVPALREKLPSSCAMWRRAEHGVFYASAAQHMECAVGAMVMGFSLSGEKQQELMSLVKQMCEVCYIKESEVPHIPHYTAPADGIVYGPLSRFPLEPDAVVLWLDARGAMLLQEALGGAEWGASPQGAVFGRPGCAALPFAKEHGSAVSLGCAGMRTFTEVSGDRMLAVVSGERLSTLGERLPVVVKANAAMQLHYDRKKREVRAASATSQKTRSVHRRAR